MTRHEEKVARQTLGNKDAQLKIVMAEDNIRRNAELRQATGKTSQTRFKCQA